MSSGSEKRVPGADGHPESPWRLAFQPVQRTKPAPCACSCPNGTDIRGWIGTIAQHERNGISLEQAYRQAWQTIVNVNPFPSVLGRICPHPCEAGCTRGDKDGAVAVNALERFIGDWGIAHQLELPLLSLDVRPDSIGVIGAGPSGLSFAYQMARRGYHVTVYERKEQPGGMLRYGIPDYRLPPEVLDAEVQRILDIGVMLRTDVEIGRDISLEDLRARHAVLYAGLGAQLARRLGIPGEEGPGVLGGIEYLAEVNSGVAVHLGAKVVVVGGGDAAIDAARSARRSGAEVSILYRRTRTEMPAVDDEVEAALAEGIGIEFLVAPVAILRRDGCVAAVQVRRMRLGEPDESGRRRPEPIPGSEFELPVDSVIVAVSQAADLSAIGSPMLSAAARNGDPFVRLDDTLWLGGDAMAPDIAGVAIAQGRMAAEATHAALSGGKDAERVKPSASVRDQVKLDRYTPKPRLQAASMMPAEALAAPAAEVNRGITEAQFLAEVERCLSCGLCFGCESCWMYCTSSGFIRLDESRSGAYFALSLDACEACGKCVDVCPCGYLEFA